MTRIRDTTAQAANGFGPPLDRAPKLERVTALLLFRAAYVFLLCAVLVFLTTCRQSTVNGGALSPVVISEFMAVNDHTLSDEDGDFSDWIEIHNTGTAPLDLEGWYLSDDRYNPEKWQFPSIVLEAQDYLVVFASGKNRAARDAQLHTNFGLQSQGGYLALIGPNGRAVASEYAPYNQQFADVSYGLVAHRQPRYLTASSPGTANAAPSENKGPILSDVSHSPRSPIAGDDLVVTVTVAETFAPITSVTLNCRMMFEPPQSVPMFDDGAHQDGAAGDGTYGAVVPGGLLRPGVLVRYSVTAADQQGSTSRWPLYNDPLDSPEYCGTMVFDPDIQSELAVLYWFVSDPAAAETGEGTRAAIYYDGILYDNVYVRVRGYTARFWPKKSFKVDLNQGHHFRFSDDLPAVEEFNLNSTVTDKSYLRQILSLEAYRDAGVPASVVVPVRVQQNGTFYSVSVFTEQPDERYMERHSLDPTGALYKLNKRNILTSATENVVKQTRLDEDHGDLQDLIDGLSLPPEERTVYLFDHVNIPEVLNYLAVATVLHDRDHGDNNYYLYRDTNGTGEWMVWPWDKDMTFGRTYLYDQGGTFNDVIWVDQDPQSHPLHCYYSGNKLFDALLETPVTQEMYLRRLRTVMDQLLQPPGTPADDATFEQRIDQLYAQMSPDVALDAERWPLDWGAPQSFDQAIEIIKADYLAARRVHLYETHGMAGSGLVPQAQPARTEVRFGDLDPNPASGNQRQEYLTLVNHGGDAVDVSGWQVVYDVEYTLPPGAVIPAGGTLHLSPDVNAFRARDQSPHGQEGHFVLGNYRGRLSNTWGVIKLYNAQGRLVSLKVFWQQDDD